MTALCLVLLVTLAGPVTQDGASVPLDVDVAQGFTVPAPAGLEAALMEDARDGTLTTVTLADAALLASGVVDARLPPARARLDAAVAAVRGRVVGVSDPRARGRKLLVALHDTLLTRYVANATSIPRLLETGEFNCLSSAVLYVLAAQGLLDEPRAMVSLVHAFARVTVQGKPVDVETTLPVGFDPDRARIFTADTVARLGLQDLKGAPADVAAQAATALELPAVALVAGIYSNRAVELLHQGDVRGAAVALDRAARVGQGPQRQRLAAWRGALLANAARQLLLQERPWDAIPLLQRGLDGVDGPTRTVLQHNLAVAWQQLATRSLAAGDPTAALRFAQRAQQAEPGLPSTASIIQAGLSARAAQDATTTACATLQGPPKADCLANASTGQLQRQQLNNAVETARLALEASAVHPNARIAAFNALNARAAAHARASRCDDATADWAAAEPLRDLAPNTPPLQQRIASCHLETARLALDSGRQEDAQAALERALTHHPQDQAARRSLAGVAHNRAVDAANAGRCQDARALLATVRANNPEATKTSQDILAHCFHTRVRTAWDQQDWPRAVLEARRGLRDAPDHPALMDALGGALHNQALEAARQGDCIQARLAATELDGLGQPKRSAAVRLACPKP